MRVKIFTIAHVPKDKATAWLQRHVVDDCRYQCRVDFSEQIVYIDHSGGLFDRPYQHANPV